MRQNRPKYYWQHDRWNAYEVNKMHRGRWRKNQLLTVIMFPFIQLFLVL